MAITDLLTGNLTSSASSALGGALSVLQPFQNNISNSVVSSFGSTLGDVVQSGLNEIDALVTTATETLNYDIEAIRAAIEPQRSWKWMVQLPSIMYATGAYSIPSYMIMSITPSFVNTDVNNYWIGAQPSNYPSDQSVSQVRLSIFLDESLTALSYYNIWKSLVRNSNRTFNYASTYKKSIYVTLLTRNSKATLQLIMKNCFPTSCSIGSLSYKGSDHMTLDMVVSVDDFSMSPDPTGIVSAATGILGGQVGQLLTNPLGVISNSIF